MGRSAATRAIEAADALMVFLHSRPATAAPAARVEAPADTPTAVAPRDSCHSGAASENRGRDRSVDHPPIADHAVGRGDRPSVDRPGRRATRAPPCHLPQPDWLHHRLTVTGPEVDLATFRQAAAGAGTIPWHLDLPRLEDDLFDRLVAPPAPQPRHVSVAGARILAGQLRDAVERRHALALARVGVSRACPFDLHTLLPVPDDILQMGPDDPDAIAWLWEHWGTTQTLRHVCTVGPERRHLGVEPAPRLDPPGQPSGLTGGNTQSYVFWSADWTPRRAIATLRNRWSALCLDVRPTYDVA